MPLELKFISIAFSNAISMPKYVRNEYKHKNNI